MLLLKFEPHGDGGVNVYRMLLPIMVVLGCCSMPAWAGAEGGSTADKFAEIIVCKKVRKTGSHFKIRVCKTHAQIDQESEDAREFALEADRMAREIRLDQLRNPARY